MLAQAAPLAERFDWTAAPVNLLLFTAPGCEVCARLRPSFDALRRSYREALAVHEVDHAADLAERTGVFRAFNVRSTPYVVAVDDAGIVRGRGIANSLEQVEELVAEAAATAASARAGGPVVGPAGGARPWPRSTPSPSASAATWRPGRPAARSSGARGGRPSSWPPGPRWRRCSPTGPTPASAASRASPTSARPSTAPVPTTCGVGAGTRAADACCAGGGLKKICDCCVTDFPNVHGYCPAGTNVKCLVESCGADPRVLTTPVERVVGDAATLSAFMSSRRFTAGSAPVVVLADLDDAFAPAIGGPFAVATGAAYLVAPRAGLSSLVRGEVSRLRSTRALMVGAGLVGTSAERDLRSLGLDVQLAGAGTDAASLSAELATKIRAANGSRRAFAVDATPTSSLAIVGAAAAAAGHPVLVGAETARQAAFRGAGGPSLVTYLVGATLSARAGDLPGGNPVWSTASDAVAADIAYLVLVIENTRQRPIIVLPKGEEALAAGLTGCGTPIVLHNPGTLDQAARVTLAQVQGGVDRAFLVGNGATDAEFTYYVQGSLSGYDTHRLQGVAGEGLPGDLATRRRARPRPGPRVGRARPHGRRQLLDRPPEPGAPRGMSEPDAGGPAGAGAR